MVPLDFIPTNWELNLNMDLITSASRRGYLFSVFCNENIKNRKICLTCGGLVSPQTDSINCICDGYYIITKERKIIKNIGFFIEEILSQNIKKSLPDFWPPLNIGKINNENEKRKSIQELRKNYTNGAFKIYNKDMHKFPEFLEKIAIDIATKKLYLSK